MTRGAIYWHFDDKGALFNAMMERVTLPFECALSWAGRSYPATVLDDVRNFFVEIFRVTETNPQARRVLEIASLKVEFVSEMDAVGGRRRQSKGDLTAQVVERLKLAQAAARSSRTSIRRCWRSACGP